MEHVGGGVGGGGVRERMAARLGKLQCGRVGPVASRFSWLQMISGSRHGGSERQGWWCGVRALI
jgi:hypothetical protein